ncbi:diacylglycerol lipase-alpha isoform X2 [Alosa sapidissima]|nr:diacylglycerol lipase-alpha isoform X2 [Alosa sapidissima]XP_041917444.1 diacylglycerol lipase-alpha isoform X2 [Alosa sapidissima]XP_041917445.1 diacylglycerol lipase-alpha isoform X2 [Alosa sapidissima]
MPGMVLFRRRWSVGSDDLVLPALFLFLLHSIWLVVLLVVLFGLPYGSDQSCSITLVDHGCGYLGILVSCLICESAIMWLSMRGSILYTQPRDAVQYVLYIRLAILLVELVYAVVGIAWLVQYYQPCSDVTAKNLTLGIVVCNWLVIFSVCFTLMCTFDPTGRTFVKLKATRRRQRNLTTYTLRHRLEEGQASSWSRRLKFIMCCARAQDTQSDAYSEVASLFAEFFRDLDIVPSDIIAGLVLLRQRQRSKRSAILDQANNDIIAFLSGMPVTRNTKYLDLKNSVEMSMYKEVCYYMLFALAAYGWPMYLLRKPACGLCRLASSCSCTSGSASRLTHAVTVEEDNCCGCNVLAVRRQFLDQDLKQVQIVYMSCHDAVYETPFFVAVDHGKKKVVISIRGTLSLKDALTDLTGDSERLPVEGQHGTWLGHKGMVYSAEYIKKKLEQEMILSQAFGRDLSKGTMHYGLVIVGHSLGAGTAAILSFLLRPHYPSLHCYAYSPPGGLLSEDAMEYSKEFCTSVVLGKDLVPRIGLFQLEGFRRHLLEVLQKSDKPKWRIIAGGTKCIPKSEFPSEEDGPQLQGSAPPSSRLWLHPSDLSIALSASTPLYPPGRVIHVVHNHPPESCCGQEEPTYSALWGDNKAFDEVIISPAMLNEHMPHMVMEGLHKVLEANVAISEQSDAESGESVAVSLQAELPTNPLLPDCLPTLSNTPNILPSPSHPSTPSPCSSPNMPKNPAVPSHSSTQSLVLSDSSAMPVGDSLSSLLNADAPLLLPVENAHSVTQVSDTLPTPALTTLAEPTTTPQVLENYNKGKTALLSAAKIMVSPTEVDLNPETIFLGASTSHQPSPVTHHRRNSSVRSCARSEISLDGFAECPPPPVPIVLTGARERLAVELCERRAPLAVMESLSDAESLYSLESRRSSAALRGSPCLGSFPFSMDAPIPEENPSLSSRTELLAADGLQPTTPEHELGEPGPYCPTPPLEEYAPRLSPDTPRYSAHIPPVLGQTVIGQPLYLEDAPQQAKAAETVNVYLQSGPPSPEIPPSVPHSPRGSSTPLERGSQESIVEMGETPAREQPPAAKAESEPLADAASQQAPLSNGNPSQVVLEFAQYLDSLFKLDGSSSPPMELSDGESESGRSSYSQSESQKPGQQLEDRDKLLLARATLEPNLVPKPPRTFAGSADPSSGISLSPSYPLSSSGELNDLSPADGTPAANHIRTSTPLPYNEENALSSMV